jgi:hypothetical protein
MFSIIFNKFHRVFTKNKDRSLINLKIMLVIPIQIGFNPNKNMSKLGKLLLTRKTSESKSTLTDDTGSFTSEGSSFSDRPLREKSSTYLDQLIFDECWEEATALVRANGRHAMKLRKSPLFMNTLGDSKLLPIHLACANPTVTFDFLESLLFSNPASIQARESGSNRLCLHIAVKCGVPDDIISYLVKTYPEGLTMQDSMGRLPLHSAISNHRSSALISEFISRYPRTVFAADGLGWSPLHVAAFKCSPISVIELILFQSIEVTTLTTLRGRTPLHVAVMSTNRNKESVIKILSKTERSLCQCPVVANYREAEKNEKNIWNTMSDTVFT